MISLISGWSRGLTLAVFRRYCWSCQGNYLYAFSTWSFRNSRLPAVNPLPSYPTRTKVPTSPASLSSIIRLTVSQAAKHLIFFFPLIRALSTITSHLKVIDLSDSPDKLEASRFPAAFDKLRIAQAPCFPWTHSW